MAKIDDCLDEVMAVDGALGAALVDYSSGLTLGVRGGGATLDMNVAAAGNTDVVRAKVRTLEMLGMSDGIEDILLTLDSQYHLIRLVVQARRQEAFFLLLILDKNRANLGLARLQLRRAEAALEV